MLVPSILFKSLENQLILKAFSLFYPTGIIFISYWNKKLSLGDIFLSLGDKNLSFGENNLSYRVSIFYLTSFRIFLKLNDVLISAMIKPISQ